MGEPVSTTTMIGMAVAAAGAAYKTVETKKRRDQVEATISDTRRKTEAQRQRAKAAWDSELARLSPEEQQRKIDEETAKRDAAYQAAAADVPQELNIVKASADAPKIVQAEAGKQLGEKLDSARAQIRGQAKLAGWDSNKWLQQLQLGRTADQIANTADFTRGLQGAASADINMITGAPASPIGDILSAGGGMLIGAGAGSAPSATLPASTAADQQWLNWYNQALGS